jgi:hypothetical protein
LEHEALIHDRLSNHIFSSITQKHAWKVQFYLMTRKQYPQIHHEENETENIFKNLVQQHPQPRQPAKEYKDAFC